MVIFNLDTTQSDLQIASDIYNAICHDIASRNSKENLTEEESEQVLDSDVIAACKEEIDLTTFKVAQLLLVQSDRGMVQFGGDDI